MARGRGKAEWARTSAILALLANAHRDPAKTRPFTPADFDPYETEAKKRPFPKTKDLSVLKAIFVDGRQGGRTHG